MATGDGAKWPGPVTFDDDRPKDGYCTIHLKIPNMKVAGGLFGNGLPKNADVKVADVSTDKISIRVTSHEDGKEYAYEKQLPEDVDKAKSEIKYKDERIMIKLCKKKPTSWGGHYQYLIKKE